MDELSEFVDTFVAKETPVGRRRGRQPKCSTPVLSSNTPYNRGSELGIGLSSNSLNDSIKSRFADLVKSRKRGLNSKQFDSKYFFDSAVDRIEKKVRFYGNDC